MSADNERKPIPVSLPPQLVEELDDLVEAGMFSSRSEALRYGARLVVREERNSRRFHQLIDSRAAADVRNRLERKRES